MTQNGQKYRFAPQPFSNIKNKKFCQSKRFIVSLDKSLEYYAFVIIMLLPHRFLVWAPHPAVLIQSLSYSGQMSLAPRFKRQSILGALRFHLWPLGSQKGLSCGHSRDLNFQLISSYSHQICFGPRSRRQGHNWYPPVPFVATRGPNWFVSCVHF